jgi:light-regulated signal transduction histidine kinase (bacteriophytochrome)
LGLARLTRQELRLQTVDLSALAKQINDEFRVENPTRVMHCRIQPEMEVVADPRLMHLLVHNLFSNAWKFTSNLSQAEIVFEAKQSGAELVYSIRDNGAGFDMAYADKLFQPFQRLHHTSEFPGNGVGLATVNRIVSRHGGRTFAHGLINHGATIYFTLGSGTSE